MAWSAGIQGLPTSPVDGCLDQPLELLRAQPGEHLDELTTLSGDHLHDQTNHHGYEKIFSGGG
ncbi:hypothetical protein ACFQ6V_25540 [Streptomyces roseifaciens]